MDAAFPNLRRKAETMTDLPLFAEPATEPRIAPALHHAIGTCQAQERRLALRAGGYAPRILAFLKANGDATRQELSDALDIPIQSVCPVVFKLREQGYLVEFDGEGGRDLKIRNHGHLLTVTP